MYLSGFIFEDQFLLVLTLSSVNSHGSAVVVDEVLFTIEEQRMRRSTKDVMGVETIPMRFTGPSLWIRVKKAVEGAEIGPR